MQSFQSDLKYIREALNLLIDKLLPYIEQKQILQFCKVLKNKIADEKVTPFSIYMETQKNFEGSQTKPVRLNNTSDEKFTNSVLSKLKQAQTEFKNNTQQFTSIYNSVKENVESVYVTSQELQIMMNEKQLQMQNKAEQRQDQIRRVSIYSKQNKQQTDADVQEEKPKEYKTEIKSEDKNVIKSDNKIGSKNDLKLEPKSDIKTDFKYSFEGSKRDLFSTQEQIPNQRITPTNQQQGQIKVEKPFTQQSPLCYQQLKPQNITPQTSNNYPKTSPNSYTQLPPQKNSQTTPFTYVQQSSLGQILYTQSDSKQNSQMGSYVPNYDLLARVDQLLQKTKIGTQPQNNIPCLTNRI
ncbi:unnamed protein product (macronuclear) [Paramecium tetraurelia]|uniref:Uncharacterized protein n=1 Tax=Paramecium tetraurelia TaxID=5888 RepID=A0E898_PARTE|nr:uncharacterized protein GSPATT00024243001 [Paramecium tetraurelia]CAK91515.1 unnamed protein product [Paramecium tetraurelia]|eukprot:XP_001458912.1 hypothetical protein (macronuclear) [Paramecium tetraurelia strain d4-2]